MEAGDETGTRNSQLGSLAGADWIAADLAHNPAGLPSELGLAPGIASGGTSLCQNVDLRVIGRCEQAADWACGLEDRTLLRGG